MKILFVSSGNAQNGISPIVKNQGESLKKEGVSLNYFPIIGKGVKGYVNGIFTLRRHLKETQYDVVHAHYWISGIVASFAGAKPLVVSLMGDDVKANLWFRWINSFFHYLFWKQTIVKSDDMYQTFGKKSVAIVPNGVDMDKFKPIERETALKITQWNREKRHILFSSNPERIEKNFTLAKNAFNYLKSIDKNIELHALVNIPNNQVPYYYNSADAVILTSLWEGSPNAIKETMACNIPIVSTDVGDVKSLIRKTEGCYLSTFDPKEFSLQIEKALAFQKRTTGREEIAHLNESIIAKKLIAIYRSIKEK